MIKNSISKMRYTLTHYEKVEAEGRWPAHDKIEVFDRVKNAYISIERYEGELEDALMENTEEYGSDNLDDFY